jgi:hypothetical protein
MPLLYVVLAGQATALIALGRVDPAAGSTLLLVAFGAATAAAVFAYAINHRDPLPLRRIVILACLLRLPLLFAEPRLSDDAWRYLHDGRAQAAGVNPFRHAPAERATETFRGPEHARINHPQHVTIYPPAAQAAFLLVALLGSSLLIWKLILLAAELALILGLAALLRARGSPPHHVALYAWHPLAIVEVAGNAHLEPLAIAALVWALLFAARARPVPAGIALGVSVAVKYWAAPLLPFLARGTPRWPVAAATGATLLILYLPYAIGANPLGSLGAFTAQWQSNAGAFALLQQITGSRAAAGALAFAGVALVLASCWRAAARAEDAAFALIFATLLLSPVVHPWYLVWLLALLVIRPITAPVSLAALWWTFAVPVAYAALPPYAATGIWQVPGWALLVQYVPLAVLLAMAAFTAVASRSTAPAVTPG